ncbi:hypothetical protein [Vibrio crassostreae]|uniref:hypothetical protein n=1 Tax=Vibrio crassostreae TaxID=246167 RepID=UPI001B313688|nr:hypothetical protein [Vibrio crassostreae]
MHISKARFDSCGWSHTPFSDHEAFQACVQLKDGGTAILSAHKNQTDDNYTLTVGMLMSWGEADYENELNVSDKGEVLNNSFIGSIDVSAKEELSAELSKLNEK